MVHHGAHKRVYEVRFVGAPVVLISGTVVEVLHPYPLFELLLPEDAGEKSYCGYEIGTSEISPMFWDIWRR